jgi:multidrug resistance protein, MATE family
MIATIISTLFHGLWLWLLITKKGMQIEGVALATLITFSSQLLIVLTYSAFFVGDVSKEAIFWPGMDSFNDWKKYLKLSIPSTLMICPEWWAFELLTVMAGWLGVYE